MAGLNRDERKAMEHIRVRAVTQILNGVPVQTVVSALGVSAAAVYSWINKYNEGGMNALRSRKAHGAAPKLTIAQQSRIRSVVIQKDPRQLQFAFALWTRELVADLIFREFGVSMSLSAVGRMLRRMGMSPQRPLWRAYQADPEAVAAWKTTKFPAIRAEAAKVGAVIFFSDEASVRSDYHAGTTWGLLGQTPIVKSTGARYSVNMMSAVSAKGDFHFMLTEGRVNSEVFISYCKRLLDDNPERPVFLVVDGHPSHKSKMTTEWVASTEGRIRLYYLPGYSPQLNPDEWAWKNVKADRIGRAGITSLDDLRSKATSALERFRRMPELVRAFFRDPDLPYITDGQ
ncbi:MAG: IS630 family transposase [Acidimicrobiales bacterium]